MAKRDKSGAGKMIGYVRVSTKEQGTMGHSLDGQMRRLADRCRDEGLELIDLVVDIECSTKYREKLAQVQERLEEGEAAGLICAKIDRVGRSQFHLASIVQWAEVNRIDILSTDEGWQVRGGKKVDAMLPFRIAMAEVELERIRQRTREGLDAAKRNGVQLGRKFENEELGRRAWTLRQSGLSWRHIAQRLIEEGARTARGAEPNMGGVLRIIRHMEQVGLLPTGASAPLTTNEAQEYALAA